MMMQFNIFDSQLLLFATVLAQPRSLEFVLDSLLLCRVPSLQVCRFPFLVTVLPRFPRPPVGPTRGQPTLAALAAVENARLEGMRASLEMENDFRWPATGAGGSPELQPMAFLNFLL